MQNFLDFWGLIWFFNHFFFMLVPGPWSRNELFSKKDVFARHCQNLRIFSCVNGFWIFDKCQNLSKRNVKLVLKILSDLKPLRGSSNKQTLYSTRSVVNWALYGTRGPLKRSFHSREPNLHTNSLNKLLQPGYENWNHFSTCAQKMEPQKNKWNCWQHCFFT
jgi:hypothetical protein